MCFDYLELVKRLKLKGMFIKHVEHSEVFESPGLLANITLLLCYHQHTYLRNYISHEVLS